LLLSFPSASRLLYKFPLFSSTIYRTAFESPPFLVTRGLLKIFYLSKLSLLVKQCHNLNNSILISTCSTWMIGKKLNGKSKGWISVSQWWEKLRKEEETLESLWWVFVGIKRIFTDGCWGLTIMLVIHRLVKRFYWKFLFWIEVPFVLTWVILNLIISIKTLA